MSNDLRLQEGHPVDENLRPIKVGGQATALETAKSGNGARVRGDLEVTGDIIGNIKDMVFDALFKMAYDATNYATFAVAADGALTITTVDADAEEADIILVPNGEVKIDRDSSSTTAQTTKGL